MFTKYNPEVDLCWKPGHKSPTQDSRRDEICLFHLFLSDEEHAPCQLSPNKQFSKVRTYENTEHQIQTTMLLLKSSDFKTTKVNIISSQSILKKKKKKKSLFCQVQAIRITLD